MQYQLRCDSQTISAQGVRIAPMSSCDVKIAVVGIEGDHQGVFEPLSLESHELGLKGQPAELRP